MVDYSVVKQVIDGLDYDDLLSIGAPNDEYDSETKMICDLITEESSVEEIAEVMASVFKKQFYTLMSVDVDKVDSFIDGAKKIWSGLHR